MDLLLNHFWRVLCVCLLSLSVLSCAAGGVVSVASLAAPPYSYAITWEISPGITTKDVSVLKFHFKRNLNQMSLALPEILSYEIRSDLLPLLRNDTNNFIGLSEQEAEDLRNSISKMGKKKHKRIVLMEMYFQKDFLKIHYNLEIPSENYSDFIISIENQWYTELIAYRYMMKYNREIIANSSLITNSPIYGLMRKKELYSQKYVEVQKTCEKCKYETVECIRFLVGFPESKETLALGKKRLYISKPEKYNFVEFELENAP